MSLPQFLVCLLLMASLSAKAQKNNVDVYHYVDPNSSVPFAKTVIRLIDTRLPANKCLDSIFNADGEVTQLSEFLKRKGGPAGASVASTGILLEETWTYDKQQKRMTVAINKLATVSNEAADKYTNAGWVEFLEVSDYLDGNFCRTEDKEPVSVSDFFEQRLFFSKRIATR